MEEYLNMFYSFCKLILDSEVIIDTNENDVVIRYKNYGISLKFWNQ